MCRYPGFPKDLLAGLKRLDPDGRIPVASAHELLRGALAITGGPELGLSSVTRASPG